MTLTHVTQKMAEKNMIYSIPTKVRVF